MNIKSLFTAIVAAVLRAVAFVRSLLHRDPVESVKAKAEKLTAALDAVVDAEVERRRRLMQRRERLRAEIDEIWDAHGASEELSLKAGKMRRNIGAAVQ